ncbi:MAG TPA: hypothetical protein VNR38_08140 [Ureibacillus sp.]|nr:hypothetical protein [Ureibacillus sp.]
MNKSLSIAGGVALLFLFLIGVVNFENILPKENVTLASEKDEVKQKLEIVLEENNKLKEENIRLSEGLQQLEDNSTNSKLDHLAVNELEKKNFLGSPKDIIAELVKHPELIPYEGVLGGDVLIREEGTKVLSHEWIFAPFDDGHILGYLLIHYSIVDGKPGNWKVIDSYMYGEQD